MLIYCYNSVDILLFNLSLVPSTSPRNYTLTTVNSTVLSANWSPPLSADRNGIITEYFLTLTAVNQELDTAERNVQISGSVLSIEFSGLDEYTWYSVVLAASTSVGKGPEVSDTAITDSSGKLNKLHLCDIWLKHIFEIVTSNF